MRDRACARCRRRAREACFDQEQRSRRRRQVSRRTLEPGRNAQVSHRRASAVHKLFERGLVRMLPIRNHGVDGKWGQVRR